MKISNADLLKELELSRVCGYPTTKLCILLAAMAERTLNSPAHKHLTYMGDTIEYVVQQLIAVWWHKCDPKKIANPFAYFTSCIMGSTLEFIKEKKNANNV